MMVCQSVVFCRYHMIMCVVVIQVIVKLEDKITLYCKGAGEFVLSVCTPYIHNYIACMLKDFAGCAQVYNHHTMSSTFSLQMLWSLLDCLRSLARS